MGDHAKAMAMVLGPEEGDSFWQPLPSTGHVINKVTPHNSPYDDFSTGIQVLEAGSHIRRHGHARSHEVLFCYRGSGYVELDNVRHDLEEESLVLIGRGVQHKIVNTGAGQMRLLWFMSPAGLEDWFAAIGRRRRPGEALPPPFERPANIRDVQAQQHFIASDEG